MVEHGHGLRVAGVWPLDLWLEGNKHVNKKSVREREGDREERFAIPEMIYTHYGLESDGQGSFFGVCGDVIKQAAPFSSEIGFGGMWYRMQSIGTLALHTAPRWTKEAGEVRVRHVWPYAHGVGYAEETKSVI